MNGHIQHTSTSCMHIVSVLHITTVYKLSWLTRIESTLTCAHLCGCVFTCASVCSLVRVCAHLCGCGLTCVGVGSLVRVWAHLCGCVFICVGVCSLVWVWAHLCGCVFICVGVLSSVGVCSLLWVWVHLCGCAIVADILVTDIFAAQACYHFPPSACTSAWTSICPPMAINGNRRKDAQEASYATP